MNKIVAAAIISASLGLLLGGERARSETIETSQSRYTLLTLIGLFACGWAITSAHSVSGALILLLVPLGSASLAFEVGAYVSPLIRSRTIANGLGCLLPLAMLVIYVIAFPAADNDF